jgi:hypothetical protein
MKWHLIVLILLGSCAQATPQLAPMPRPHEERAIQHTARPAPAAPAPAPAASSVDSRIEEIQRALATEAAHVDKRSR